MCSVSVIIPTYNRKQTLKEAIKSVSSQTFQPIEIIIVDDGSTDGTSDWIIENHPDIILIESPFNRGAACCRNEAIKIAKGSLIAFLDSDDVWLSDYLSLQVEILKKHPNVCGVFSNHFKVDKDGNEIAMSHQWPIRNPGLHLIIGNNFIHTMSLIVLKKEVFSTIGLLREDMFICHDREFYIRMLAYYDLEYNPVHLVKRKYSSNQVTGEIKLWYNEATKLLDLFFRSKEHKGYLYLRHLAYYRVNITFYDRAMLQSLFFLKTICQLGIIWHGLFIDKDLK